MYLPEIESAYYGLLRNGANEALGSIKAPYPQTGLLNFTIAVPDVAKPVAGRGVYLPESASAWGHFPGTVKGGTVY